ncbi:MAG: D-glycerate dehydrogenase [Patescibacteria group bacterium]|jgi:glyoxylate reductase|nr:D-glycerate dehydrogenase [Patescibacteria group bacterium]
MAKIFVTRDIPDHGLKLLKARKGVQVSIYKENKAIPRGELLKRVKGVDILLPLLTDKIDAGVMDAAGPKLKMIANYAVGFDNIDLKAAAARNIVVTNAAAPEVSESVAEHAIAMIFALAHRIVETDTWTRQGKYKGWGPKLFLGSDLKGKTLGLIGAGAIGSAIARRLRDGFDVEVVYTDIKRNEKLEAEGAKFLKQDQLLRHADFVSLHVPLLPSTHHLISTKELKLMKKTAFLINTSRGPIVDEIALVKALLRGDIAGAGLDVYECEPLIDCNPKDTYELRKLPNVVLTPHTASATVEARQAMSVAAATNILAFLDGKQPPNVLQIK